MVSRRLCPPGARGLLALLLLLPPPVQGARGGCGAPPSFSFAVPRRETRNVLYYPGYTVRYSCLPGFALASGKSPSVTCLSNSTWSENPEFCVAVTYKCYQGSSLIGEASIHCTTKDDVNGEWNGSAPECTVQCPKPEVQNGRMANALDEKTWYNVNETIPFKCSPGYQFSSHSHLPATDRFSITCLADGNWSALPKCKKQSASDVCEVVPERKEFLDCDVPLAEMKTLLELQKIYLEIKMLKQELKLQ